LAGKTGGKKREEESPSEKNTLAAFQQFERLQLLHYFVDGSAGKEHLNKLDRYILRKQIPLFDETV